MMLYALYGFLSLIVILISCEVFTNAIEWTGRKFDFHHGVTGSILAAVGTALPETLIPIIAVLFVPGRVGEEIGVGAILGAPFMLSTLAFGITGLAVIVYHIRKKRSLLLDVNDKVLSNDMLFFFIVYVVAIAFSFLPPVPKKAGSILFILLYAAYIYRTFKTEGAEVEEDLKPLYFRRTQNPPLRIVLIQDVAALLGIIVGARFFVHSIEHLTLALNIRPFIFSLFLAPIATELPEKFNSVMWIRQRKDTLALGNISGAMVFQSSIVVFVGIVATEWVLDAHAILSAVIALLSSCVIIGYMKIFKRLHAGVLLFGLAFYVLYVLLTLVHGRT